MRQGLTYAMEDNGEPLELHVFTGSDGEFVFYDDAGDDYAYERGEYETVHLAWSDADATLTIGERCGRFAGMKETRRIRIYVDGEYRMDTVYTGEKITLNIG
jgi:alpha-D-xyloside xylohydrolase